MKQLKQLQRNPRKQFWGFNIFKPMTLVGRVLHCYHRDHGFQSHWSLRFHGFLCFITARTTFTCTCILNTFVSCISSFVVWTSKIPHTPVCGYMHIKWIHVIRFFDLVLWVLKIKKPMILCACTISTSSEQSTKCRSRSENLQKVCSKSLFKITSVWLSNRRAHFGGNSWGAQVYGLFFLIVLFECWLAGQTTSDHIDVPNDTQNCYLKSKAISQH